MHAHKTHQTPRTQADELFDRFDEDGSGTIELAELHKKLRKRAKVEPRRRRRAPSGASPARPQPASLVAGRSAVQQKRAARQQALEAEAEARRRLARAKRELARAQQEFGRLAVEERNRRRAKAVQAELDARANPRP